MTNRKLRNVNTDTIDRQTELQDIFEDALE